MRSVFLPLAQGTLLLAVVLSASARSSGCIVYTPPHTDCIPYSTEPQYQCETHTLAADGSEFVTKDIITQAALTEQAVLEAQGKHYASQFALSYEQGYKIALQIHHLETLSTRTDQDVADFARHLYGVDPRDVISAAGKAQAGDPAELNRLADKAAANFGTTPDNMKRIVRALHGQLLESQGIRF
jgi:hypothetical protein